MIHPGQLLKKFNLYADKEMGQNFLFDSTTAEKIVDQIEILKDSRVLEIGPGLGALTVHIAKKSNDVTAVEKDSRLLPLLQKELIQQGVESVHILNQDILQTDLKEIAGDNKLIIIGNLPYNISSQILFRLVKERLIIQTACLMFQKELAQRIIGPPGNRNRGRLSAVMQYVSDISLLIHVKPGAFFPRPEVDSSVLQFDFKKETLLPPDMDDLVFKIIKAAFSKRRKFLKNAMVTQDLGIDNSSILKVLERAEISPERRAETLSIEEFVQITRAVSDFGFVI